MTPSCKRRFRNCNEFGICVNIGQNGYVLAEDVETFESNFYVVNGIGKIAKCLRQIIQILMVNLDVREYEKDNVVFKSDDINWF